MNIFIASFGSKVVISNILVLHQLPVTDIYTSGRYDGFEDGEAMENKNKMIEDACEIHHLHKPFLIDDSKKNIDELKWKRKDAGGYHVRGNQGLSIEDVKNIEGQIQGYDAFFIDADMTLFRDHITSKYLYPWQDAGHCASDMDVTQVVLAEGARPLFKLLNDRM